MEETEDQGPEWFNQPETKSRLRAMNTRVEQARLALLGKCATSTDPEVRAGHAQLQALTVAAALFKATVSS